MWFDGFPSLGRVVLIGLIAYFALVFLLRVSGKRTLSKWNPFDTVVTIAFGSILATAFVSDKANLVGILASLVTLVLLQYLLTSLAVRSPFVERLIKPRATLLLYEGKFCSDALKQARVPEEEIRAAARLAGHASLDDIHAIVLETDGSFSVLAGSDENPNALAGVIGYPADETDQSSSRP